MNKVLAVFIALALFASLSVAAPAANSGAGKLGIGSSGTTIPGIGLRYWISAKNAWDFNLGFRSAKDSSDMGFGASFVNVMKQTSNLKYLWLAGLQYIGCSAKTAGVSSDTTDTILGFGLGVEYNFTELPDLSFNAFLTGIGIDMVNRPATAITPSSSETVFASDPKLGFAIRYYVK
ncbi:MAG: hypothetical protein ABII64_04585 [Elusimicrobiota bacterium]